MIDKNVNNPKSPKYYVKRYLESIKHKIKNKIVIDIPAGNGATTEMLLEHGALAEPLDLFPEYFLLKNIECRRADLTDKIPTPDNYTDMLICEEGIEHLSDQLKAFKEFNRVLKLNGELLLTTPTHSNLASKFSYLLFESETNGQMPPNEIDDIWMSDKNVSNEIYYGHLFLIGLLKLRILGKLSGFTISEIHYLRTSKGSLLLLPFFYPFILISSCLRYLKYLRKHKDISLDYKKNVYLEILKININPLNLLNKHTFIVFKKTVDCKDIDFRNDAIVKPFGEVM